MSDRFWVGGTADWDATAGTKWALTSGGAGGEAVPGAADDVFFDGSSGAGTTTITAGVTINSLDFTGYTGAFTHNASVTITIDNKNASNRALLIASGMGAYTLGNAASSAYSFTYTSTGATITSGGKTLGSITFNGAGGEWTLQDTLTMTGGTLTFTTGTLNTNGQTVTMSLFSSSSGSTRVLTMGSSAFTALVNAGGWSVSNVSGLTITANTATITLSGNNPRIDSATKDWNGASIVFTGGADATANIGGSTFANITHTGTAAKTGRLLFNGSPIITGTFTVNGNSSVNRILVASNVFGSSRTITSATNSFTNVDFQDITGAGAASWNVSAITGLSGDAGGNSGITFTTAQTQYWVGDTGSWSTAAEWGTTSGGSGGRVPLPQDDVVFDNNSFSGTSQTVTQDMPRMGKSVDWSAYNEGQTPTWTLGFNGGVFYGSLTLNSGMTFTMGANTMIYEGRGASTMTTAGKTFANEFYFGGATGSSLTLQDAFTSSNNLRGRNTTNGTFDANDFNITVSGFVSWAGTTTSGTITMGNGTWTLSGTASVWTTISANTVNAEGSTIILSNTTATSKTFAGGGKTFNNLTITGDDITITGNNTFNNIALNNPTEAEGLIIGTGSTQTITGNLTTTASSGNVVLLSGVAGGGAESISKASGTVSVDWMTITNSTATGGATFYAGANSTDGGGNSGWIFTAPPSGFTATPLMYMMAQSGGLM